MLSLIDMTTGKKVKAIAIASKLTQSGITKTIGSGKSYISQVQKGNRPASESLINILKSFNIFTGDLDQKLSNKLSKLDENLNNLTSNSLNLISQEPLAQSAEQLTLNQ